jgi:hypothetical protein
MDEEVAAVVVDVSVSGYPLLHQHDDDNGACNNDDAFSSDDAGVVLKAK